MGVGRDLFRETNFSSLAVREEKDSTHHSETSFHHRAKIRPMVLKWDRVDYVNSPTRRGRCTEEDTVDCLVRMLEGMEYDFGVGEVGELKAWTRHAADLSSRG